MRKGLIYLIGVLVLGLAYGWLKGSFSAPIHLALPLRISSHLDCLLRVR